MQADRSGIPLMLEPAYWGAHKNAKTDAAIADSARLSLELGAHILKLPAPTDVATLKKIVGWSTAPIFILGGTPTHGAGLLEQVDSWLDAGACGVVVGRNIWNRPDPAAAIAALDALVHSGELTTARSLMRDAGEPLGR